MKYLGETSLNHLISKIKGVSDYNNLTNKPITQLTGTESSPIYLRTLQTGAYILNGNCSPYNGSDVYMGANNAITFVNNFDTVTAIQIFYPPYNQVQYFEVYDDNYTTNTVMLNNLATTEYVDNKYVVLYENESSPVGTGTITLNDAIENYSKVDITFINNDGETCGVTVYNPSNKKICLNSAHAGGTQYYYIDYFAYITLSGTTGTYSEGRTLVVDSSKSIYSIAACDLQKITKIVGYK